MSSLIYPQYHKPTIGQTLDHTNPLTAGLVFFAPLWEGTGAAAYDIVGGRQIPLTGSPTWTSSTGGRCLDMSPSAAYGQISPVDPRDYVSYPSTIAARIMWTGATQTGNVNIFGVYAATTGTVFARIRFGTAAVPGQLILQTSGGSYTAPTTLVAGQWTTLVVASMVGRRRIYQDGVLLASTSLTNNTPTWTGTSSIAIGHGSGTCPIAIDWAGWWNREITTSEAFQLHANPWQIFEAPKYFILSLSTFRFATDSATFSDGQKPSSATSASENWDGVTAPSTAVAGWTVDAGIITSTFRKVSGANSLASSSGTFAGTRFATFDTPDSDDGSVSIGADFWLTDVDRDNAFGLVGRGDTNPLTTSSTFYGVETVANQFSASNWKIVLYKQIAGSITTISSLTGLVFGTPTSGWYRLELDLAASTQAARLIRSSDGYYLDSSGTFVSGVRNCLTGSDTSITGSGYVGLYFWGQSPTGSVVYTDDFSASGVSVNYGPEFTITRLFATDSATAEEYVFTAATVFDTDTVSASEYADVIRAVLATDTASATEFRSVSRAVFATDTAQQSEYVFVTRRVFDTDTATVSGDFASTNVVVYAFDSATASEAGWRYSVTTLYYRVYANDGAGGPIDYTAPVDSGEGLTWTSSVLTYAASYKWGVRVYDYSTTLEEKNIDAAVSLVLDADGDDVTDTPLPPIGLRAIGLAGGYVRIEWDYPHGRAKRPTGFRIYHGTSGTPDYGTVVRTVAFTFGFSQYAETIGPLTDGTTYEIGVRAYNATAEESNTNTVSITADATGPTAVASLTASTTV